MSRFFMVHCVHGTGIGQPA